MRRQTLLTVLTAVMLVLAGCAGSTGGGGSPTAEGTATPTDDATTDGDSGGTATGTVKFYVSDRPGQIEDFRHLNVTIDRIEFKRAGGDGESGGMEADDENETETPDDETETPENETETPDDETETPENETESIDDETDDDTANETTTNSSGAVASDPAATNSTATPDESDADDEDERDDADETNGTESRQGWITYDVDDRTVDLTELKGDNATLVGTPELPAGNYTKVVVYVSDINATLTDGSSQRVKLPSGKLQLNKGFTLEPNGTVSFVYDISVFKAGKSGKYILKPVISQSGTDVEVDDVDEKRERDDENDSEPPEDDTTESETKERGGPPEKPGKN